MTHSTDKNRTALFYTYCKLPGKYFTHLQLAQPLRSLEISINM